jgi:hypothetical protein
VNGNGIHPITAEQSDESSEDDISLLPQTIYTPPAVHQRRDAQNTTGVNGYRIRYATEESSDDSPGDSDGSVTSTPGLTSTQHVFQLPMVIDGGSPARLQTKSGHNCLDLGTCLGQRR